LGRKFRLAHAKNELAVLNGVMQGSVAHAMQSVVWKIWKSIGTRLITEIHDSLVVASSRQDVSDTIDLVSKVMLHPFKGIVDTNPAFPLKVSIGKKWKKWKLLRVYR
jgi:DNA polymerase I-like protein with 3'-5' exonuclease and polymerase domains